MTALSARVQPPLPHQITPPAAPKPFSLLHVYWPNMQIISTSTAFPPHYFPQEEVVEALTTQWEKGLENAAVIERLHSRTGV